MYTDVDISRGLSMYICMYVVLLTSMLCILTFIHTYIQGLLKRFDVRGFEIAHAGSVNDAIFSPSEQRVATAGGGSFVHSFIHTFILSYIHAILY